MTTPATGWMDRAACIGSRLFFPKGNPWHPGYQAQVVAAAKICARCPVKFQCRSAATQRQEHHGIWGGLDFGAGWNPTGRRRRAGVGAARKERPRIVEIDLEEKAPA